MLLIKFLILLQVWQCVGFLSFYLVFFFFLSMKESKRNTPHDYLVMHNYYISINIISWLSKETIMYTLTWNSFSLSNLILKRKSIIIHFLYSLSQQTFATNTHRTWMVLYFSLLLSHMYTCPLIFQPFILVMRQPH